MLKLRKTQASVSQELSCAKADPFFDIISVKIDSLVGIL